MSRLVSLYPASWRARYEDEFLAVLESRPPTVADRLDILRGVLDARFHPQVPGRHRARDWSGIAPLAGLVSFWVALWLVANGPIQYDGYGSYRDGAAALPFLILAFVLLSVGLYRIVRHLPPEAGGAAIAGSVAFVAGPTWAAAPWLFPVGLVFLVGVLGLTIGARRAGLMPRGSVALLVLGVVLPTAFFAASFVLPWYWLRMTGLEIGAVLAGISVLWIVVAWTLLRGFESPAPAAQQ